MIERQELYDLDPYEQNIAENFMQKNFRRVGEENRAVRIGSLDLLRGFKVKDMAGQDWTVRMIGKKGDILVRKPNIHPDTGERKFEYKMFPPSKFVRIPKEEL